MKKNIAELNIAFPKFELTDPRIADFVNNIELVNSVAARSDGFVWRYGDDQVEALQEQTLFPKAIINMSVWKGEEEFKHFVYNTVHKKIINRKAEWFEETNSRTFVMWWIEDGHVPSLIEAKERLEELNKNGDSDAAFGWQYLNQMTN